MPDHRRPDRFPSFPVAVFRKSRPALTARRIGLSLGVALQALGLVLLGTSIPVQAASFVGRPLDQGISLAVSTPADPTTDVTGPEVEKKGKKKKGGGGGNVNEVSPTNSSPIALTSDDKTLVSVNPDDASVTVFDVASTPIPAGTRIAVGVGPRSVAIAPDNITALVTNQGGSSVSVLNLSTKQKISDINLTGEPYGVVFNATGSEAWVTNAAASNITVLQVAGTQVSVKQTVPLPANVRTVLENPRLEGIGITKVGGQEFAYVTQFLSQLGGAGNRQAKDDGKVGKVFVFNVANKNLVDTINLGAHDTGFDADRTLFGGSAATPTTAFPNQLQALAFKGNRAYLPNTAASPEGPVKFDVDTQAFLGVINTGNNTEDGGQNVNLNKFVKDQQGATVPKLFRAIPWAVAFEHKSNDGFVVSLASNVLTKITLAGDGTPGPVFDNVTGGTQLRFIEVGKSPQGIVINSNDTRAFVMNFISRDVSVVDLTATPVEKVIDTLKSADLPTPGSNADKILIGHELFNTSVGVFEQIDPATNQPVRGRMSKNGWQACASCHPDGLTDGVVWAFPAGPRHTIPLNTSFNPHDTTQARILNYSAQFDEIQDFEANIRNVSGGDGVIVLPNTITPDPTLNAFALPNAGRNQLTVRGQKALDAIAEWVKEGIRDPISPESATDPDVIKGRDLFTKANCQSCHGGGDWTVSIRDFTPVANTVPLPETAVGTAPEPTNVQFLPRFLRLVGTFDPTSAIEKNQNNQGALGRQGFNSASLLGIFALGPFNHHGDCETLACVIDNNHQAHRTAGVVSDVLGNVADQAAVVKFVRSIGIGTAQIDPVFSVRVNPGQGNLAVKQGQQGQVTIKVTGSGQVALAVAITTLPLPTGVTAAFNPTNGAAPFNSTLTFTAAANATIGQAFVQVCGTNAAANLKDCTVLGLNVTAP